MTTLGTWICTRQDQRAFADASGDWNPIHLDPRAARRTLAGAVVIHGMHAALRALELYLTFRRSRTPETAVPTRLTLAFSEPLFPDEPITVQLVREEADGRAHVRMTAGGALAVDVKLRVEPGCPAPTHDEDSAAGGEGEARPLHLEDLEGRSGVLAPRPAASILRQLFPVSCALAGLPLVQHVAALSRLVGMECPGLHSLLMGADLSFTPDVASGPLHYRVRTVDPRFSMLRMGVEAPGLTGSVTAFLRPPPVPGADLSAIASRVRPDEFRNRRALVVGGSRGLGEATAKILACGGGKPILTYHMGREDTLRVANDIQRNGGMCEILQFDVTAPGMAEALQPLKASGGVGALYYFATPKIFARRTAEFDTGLFRNFCQIYVEGFARLCEVVEPRAGSRLAVFYPSSVAIDEAAWPLVEYAAAKQAGEALCRHLRGRHPSLNVLVERLPRVFTDQTATLHRVPADDAVDVMLPLVRRMMADADGA